MKTTEERALDAVRKRNPEHTNFFVISVVPRFLDGTLYVVGFPSVGAGGFENYAYVPDRENEEVHVYRNVAQLTNAVSIQQRRDTIIDKIVSLGSVTGILAIGITATICYMALQLKSDFKVPEVLSNALTMILGFYFGTKTQRKDP